MSNNLLNTTDLKLDLDVLGVFATLEEAEALAFEVFTCVIAAVGRTDSGKIYLRPPSTKDSSVFAFAVIAI